MTSDPMQNLEFRVFEGPNHREMSKLIAEGLVPTSAAQIMRGWLEGRLDRHWYHDSGDAIVYHPDGCVKLVWDSQDLRKLNTESPRVAGALVLPAGAWESIDGEEFSKGKFARYTGKQQSKDNAKGNPFWQWLARDDQGLLGEYADQMFSRVKQSYCCDEAMGVYISDPQRDGVVLRLWCLGGVDLNCGDADGDGHVDGNDGRLVGVASEAPRVFGPCATYRDAPRHEKELKNDSSGKRPSNSKRTLWDILNTPLQNLFGERNDK